MTSAVLFDLGNTLAEYYHASEFAPVLERSVAAVRDELVSRAECNVTMDAALEAAVAENREAPDFRVLPMIERLERVFRTRLADNPALARIACERFLDPIFALGRIYDDVLPTLARLEAAGVRTAIVSNAPWGSPPDLWRHELARLKLLDHVGATVFCGDVGWRKPARAIFEHALRLLGCSAGACVFVGDDPAWDVGGSAAVGMRPILIDRERRHADHAGERIESLRALEFLL